jgi:hypothetical protein
VAAAGQFSWPPAGSYLAVSGQFLVAVVTLPAERSFTEVHGKEKVYGSIP